MQRFREFLTLLLIGLLPFHALFITFATKILRGPDHAPLASLTLWKEGVLVVIVAVAVIEIGFFVAKKLRTSGYGLRVTGYGFDWIDVCIIGLVGLSLILETRNSQLATRNFLYGFKYDLLPLCVLLVLRRVPWSAEFQRRVLWLLLAIGGLLSAYAIVTLVLPLGFFRAFGYSNLHSLYLPDQPLPPYHQIAESAVRRIQGTFSGPNQLGTWLLIPLGAALALIMKKKPNTRTPGRVRLIISGLIILALILSFSRSAWIGAVGMILVALAVSLPRKTVQRVVLWGAGAAVAIFLASLIVAPKVLFRLSSSRGHLERPLKAIALMMEHPLGMGLGTAGPASNRTSDPCVELRPEDDPSWAKSTPNLCVFLGEKQVQPLDRECHCPITPENWYLQIGIELGFIGMVFFMALTVLILWKLPTTHYALLTFLGISIAALFLHAWEDAAVAYTAWILVAVALSAADMHDDPRPVAHR